MFDKSTVDSYRQISAPPALREKVMAMAGSPVNTRNVPARIMSIAAAAACLVLVAVGALLFRPANDITVAYNGAELTSEAVVILPEEDQPALLSARIVPPVTAVLSVSTDKPTEISVSGGWLVITSDDCAVITSGTDCTAGGVFQVEWTLSLVPGQTETITIGSREYIITQSGEGISTIREA